MANLLLTPVDLFCVIIRQQLPESLASCPVERRAILPVTCHVTTANSLVSNQMGTVHLSCSVRTSLPISFSTG